MGKDTKVLEFSLKSYTSFKEIFYLILADGVTQFAKLAGKGKIDWTEENWTC